MTRAFRIALLLSVAAHFAFLLLRIDREAFDEGDLLSLDVRLQQVDGMADSAPELLEASEPEAPAEEIPEETPPEEAEALIAEKTESPRTVKQPAAQAAPQSSMAPALEPQAPMDETPSEPVEILAGSAAEPPTTAIRQHPVESPSRPRLAFSNGEQRMLDRKVKQWGATFHRMNLSDSAVTWKHRGQPYAATFERLPAKDDQSFDELAIEISKEADGNTLSTELRLRRLGFSNFAQFVDEWDPRVQIHDDEVDGRFHSNSEIYLTFDRTVGPVFHGKVTTSFRGINTENARGGKGRDEMFLGGLETGVRRISLPRELTPRPGELAPDQVHLFQEDTRLTFYSDGTFARQPLESTEPEKIFAITDDSAYLVAGPKVALHVKGVVNGGVVVYSPSRIVIEDDLIYASHPDVEPDSDDYLGLISERYIEIAEEKVTGPGDLMIHGSLYAKRRFSVSRFRSRGDGTLFIYGSLTAGTISATEPRYRTKIRFDPRLADIRPPGFPMTDRYEVAAWDSRWTVR